jgi:hypothetical protein
MVILPNGIPSAFQGQMRCWIGVRHCCPRSGVYSVVTNLGNTAWHYAHVGPNGKQLRCSLNLTCNAAANGIQI